MQLRFSAFTLDIDRGELRGPDGQRHVDPKTFALLRHLAEHPDRVVGPDELIEAVWGGLHVSDAAVATVVKLARKAVGDTGEAQDVIRTVRGQGFRMVTPVTIALSAAAAVPDAAPGANSVQDGRGRPTIAVLPFRLPDEPGTASVLGDAVAAEVTQYLSRLHWLRVVARESAFRFRAAEVDLSALHATLGADYAIAGALWREAGNRWSAQVDLSHTVSQTVLWTDRITGDIGDVAAFRDTIAAAVLAALELRVPLHQAEGAQRKPFETLDAWEAFHLGLRQVYRFTRAGNAEAARLFERATILDPYFAAAFAARSFTSFQDATMSYTADRAGSVADVRRFAERAIEIDPLDPSSNFAMGRNLLLSRDAEGAIDWLDRAIELNPSYAKAHYSRGFAKLWSPRLDGARASFATSIRLSPLDPLMGPMLSNLGVVELAGGRLAEGADLAARGARIAPNHFILQMLAAATSALAGDFAAAARFRAGVLALMPGASVTQFVNAVPYASPGLAQTICEGLRQAGFPD